VNRVLDADIRDFFGQLDHAGLRSSSSTASRTSGSSAS
jgi:hypothetical protein